MGQIKNIKLHIVTDIKVSKKQQKKQQQQQQQPQQQQPSTTPTQGHANPAHEALYNEVTAQGTKIRNLKSAKAEKAAVLAEVEELKKLKAQYKEATGREYAPPAANNQPPASKPTTTTTNMAPTPTTPNIQSPEVELLSQQITQQGDKIRQLKADKVTKDQLKPEIDNLLKLKAQYKKITGTDYQPPSAAANNTPKKEN